MLPTALDRALERLAFAGLRSDAEQIVEPLLEGSGVGAQRGVGYPDVVVFCGPVQGQDRTLTDAGLLVEVLSPSTAATDHGTKWVAYRSLPSLSAYLLVEQSARRAHLYTRTDPHGRWEFRTVEDGEGAVALGEPFGTLAFDTIYEGTSLARSA